MKGNPKHSRWSVSLSSAGPAFPWKSRQSSSMILRTRGLYARGEDPLASTQFIYSRFFTPSLTGFRGWALFCDCDFLWLADVAELFAFADATKALHCVQHDYRPTETTKMDGQIQTVYPRQNWSSLMLFNCEHPSVRQLTPRRLPAPPAMGRRRRYRRASRGMELARGLVEPPCLRHAESGPFYPGRALVRTVAERGLRRLVARRTGRLKGRGRPALSRASSSRSEVLEQKLPLRTVAEAGVIGLSAADALSGWSCREASDCLWWCFQRSGCCRPRGRCSCNSCC
jgi:hypothetical protein